ncbi:uncharacterized protein LOC119674207 [Teleopsis dalmanni]|uniref:uncharacterized protein LOC119674207 n=1 Tax=Teleopsis dalmanni TaxID=139649 RepID=UPI0018CD388D|nr:uncharacterized protein LOC119674207 [Teleopsis dalmanni]
MNTLYAAHLKTLITSHPSLPQIMTFDDLRKTNVKILADKTEINIVDNNIGVQQLNKIRDLLDITDTIMFQKQRQILNTSHAYPVSTSMWSVTELQQRFFGRKIFHAPKAMVILEMVHLGIPLQENSILKESLDRYIMFVHAAGLLQHWYISTFKDMLSAGKISRANIRNDDLFRSLRIKDLKWIWIFISCGYILSTIAFLIEMFINFVKWKHCTKLTF